MNTVNIIEIPDTDTMAIQQLVAFADHPLGNKQAEELFRELVAANTYFDENEKPDVEQCIEEGYFEAGTYYVAIVHSTPDPGAK